VWSAFVINHLVRFAEVDDSRSFFEMQLIGFMNCTDAIGSGIMEPTSKSV